MELQLISDSACGLSKEVIEENGIDVIPFLVSYGDDHYHEDFFELGNEEFYQTLSSGKYDPKTSTPTPEAYFGRFAKYAEEGKDIICVCITSKFSSAYSNAVFAASQIKEKYGKIKIEVIDSTILCVIQGLLALDALRLSKEGKSFSEITDTLNRIKQNLGLVFTLDTLAYAMRGGRLGKAASMAADLLNIKAVLSIEDGEVLPCAKVRTRKRAMDKIIDIVAEKTSQFKKERISYYLLHTEAYDDAVELGRRLTERIGYEFKTAPSYVSSVIGAHCGPRTIGIGYYVSE